MIRRHFFLVAALAVLVLMALGATYKLTIGKQQVAAGGPPGAAGPAAKGAAGKGPAGAAGRGPGGGRGVMVTAVAVQTRTFTDRLQVLGVAKGRESVTLTSNNAEMIDEVRFRPGDFVKKGQILVELRRTEEDAAILQARSDVNLAKITYDRWNALSDRGFAAKANVDQYAAAYERAKATLEAAEARQGDRVIKAPFSGVIGLTDIAAGALISPGTAIATLDDVSVMRVDFDIPDRYLSLVREGGQIVATNDAYPGERYLGRIAKLDTRIDERARSIKARAEFPNPGGRLKPGMLMRVGVDRGQRQAVGAPESAVNFSGGQAYVYLIGTRGEGSYAQQRPIVVGSSDCGFIEVQEGLDAGDRIVADGLNRIQPNQGLTVVSGPGARAGRGGPGMKGAPGAGPKGAEGKGPPAAGAANAQAKSAPARAAAPVAKAEAGCGVNGRVSNIPQPGISGPAASPGMPPSGRGSGGAGAPGRPAQAAAK